MSWSVQLSRKCYQWTGTIWNFVAKFRCKFVMIFAMNNLFFKDSTKLVSGFLLDHKCNFMCISNLKLENCLQQLYTSLWYSKLWHCDMGNNVKPTENALLVYTVWCECYWTLFILRCYSLTKVSLFFSRSDSVYEWNECKHTSAGG